VIVPAIHDLETGSAFVLKPAVGEGDRIAEPPAPNHHIVAGRSGLFFRHGAPEMTPEVDGVDLRREEKVL
jgi:hypothetical protein